MERLPEVVPSLGLVGVDAVVTFTRSMLTSSSSATICRTAVSMPWPISILPGRISTVPSLLMVSH